MESKISSLFTSGSARDFKAEATTHGEIGYQHIQIARAYQAAAAYRGKEVQAQLSSSQQEMMRYSKAMSAAKSCIAVMLRGASYLKQAREAKEGSLNFWSYAVQQLNIAAAYYRKEAEAYASGSKYMAADLQQEALSFEKSADRFFNAVDYLARAHQAIARGDVQIGKLWDVAHRLMEEAITSYARSLEPGTSWEKIADAFSKIYSYKNISPIKNEAAFKEALLHESRAECYAKNAFYLVQ